MKANHLPSRPSKLRDRRRFRPAVLSLEERMLMTTIPTFAQQDGLSVKRVPGFLAGSDVKGLPPNLAVPYDLANQSNRVIDDRAVDYWALTLNKLDSFVVTITPQDGKPASDFAVRISGPDTDKVNGPAATGMTFAFTAKQAGTYIVGISTSADTNYAFKPDQKQPAPSGASLREYTASFNTYPGGDTNMLDILEKYRNPAYAANGWPTFTPAQNHAYETLVKIARAGAGSKLPGSGLKNFIDFRRVNVTNPAVIAGWLTATWAPLQNLLNNATSANIVRDTYNAYPVIRSAYPHERQWERFANVFIGHPAAFVRVHSLLAGADEDRANMADFLSTFERASNNTETELTGDALNIAETMQQGLQPKEKPVSTYSWRTALIDFFLKFLQFAAATAGALIGTAIEPGGGTVIGTLIGNMIGAGIASLLKPLLDQATPPPPKTSVNLAAAATNIDNTMKKGFGLAFRKLTAPKFLTSAFSNYGLLDALGTIQFSNSALGSVPPTNVTKQVYDTSVWAQLLPQLFKWKLVGYDAPSSSLPRLTSLVPSTERVIWDNPGSGRSFRMFSSPPKQVMSKAASEVAGLQGGTQFSFNGYDFTPTDAWGPGAISGTDELQGRAFRFYAITTDASLRLYKLFRHNQFDGHWYTSEAPFQESHAVQGVAITEWELVTRDGDQEISPAAAAALFGTTPDGGFDPKSPIGTYDGGKYVNFAVPADGLVSRSDVFSQWGKGDPGFSPGSFRPTASDVKQPGFNGHHVGVTQNKNNIFSHGFDESYVDYEMRFG